MKKRILAACLVIATVLTVFAGCSYGKPSTEGATVKWYIPAAPIDEATPLVLEYVKEKLGIDLVLSPISFGDYDQKMQVMNAGGEEYDIAFTSSWCNNYNKNITNGTIIPLDDLIKEYAPETYALMSPEIWDLSRVDGKLYGIINQQIMGRGAIFTMPELTLKTLGLKDEDFETYKDAEKYFRAIKEKTGQYTYVSEIWATWIHAMGFEEILGQKVPGSIYVDDSFEDVKIVNQYETEEFKDYIKWRRNLVLEGLTPPTVHKVDSKEIALKSGDTGILNYMHFQPTYKPGIENEWPELPNNCGSQVAINIQEPYLSTYAVTSTMNSISATSKNPEAAMKVLNLVNTDATLFNYFASGVEGITYKKNEDGRIEALPGQNLPRGSEWSTGNVFNSYLTTNDAPDTWEKTKEINENAKKSVVGGFVPDIEGIKTQVYNCTAVVDEYLQPLDYGIVDIDTAYPEFINKLKSAGVDDVIAEVNRQLEEWKKNK